MLPDKNIAWRLCMLLLLGVTITLLPDFAFAQGADTPIGNTLCTVTTWFTGNLGKGIETISITIIGIMALLGKISWGKAMLEGGAVAAIGQGAVIVSDLGAGATASCATS